MIKNYKREILKSNDITPRKGYKDEDKLQAAVDKIFNEWLEETNQMPCFYRIQPLANLVAIGNCETQNAIIVDNL